MLTHLLTHTPLLYLTQSLWRDEAFSVLAAERQLSFIVTRLGFEPPVYYTLLHFWIKIFGESEIAVRSLSMIGFLLATVIVIEWASGLYKKHWLSWFTPLFFFLNPMLLYYSFEVRTYAWYTFFSVAMLVSYATRRWKWFTVAAILGFYTHVYLLPFVGTLFLHWAWIHRTTLKTMFRNIRSDAGILSFSVIFLSYVPWLIKIIKELPRMTSSWYFPVDIQLVKSVLGNLFLGYEGTPWYGWKYTAYVSACIFGLGYLAWQKRTDRAQTALLFLFGALPLAIIVGISFIKPLYVNRYLIPTTVAEIFVITTALSAVKSKIIQKAAAAILLAGVIWFNWWYPPQHKKQDVRETFIQVNTLKKPNDVILAGSPMIYLETLYYASDRSSVYLYNPTNGVFPWYIGDALITPSRMVSAFPDYPTRAFLIGENGTYEVVYRMPL